MREKGSREELLERVERAALENEAEYHGCSQCVLKALQDNLNIGDILTLKSASALATGVALMGDSCGALIAGVIALGIVNGREDLADFPALQASLAPARRLYRWFRNEFGSAICRDIQTSLFGRFFNLADPEEYKKAQEAGLYDRQSGCPKVVAKVARKTAELILDLPQSQNQR